LYLEEKFEIPIEKIPEYITKGKETIDRLEDQRQEILRQTQQAREERDAIRQERDALDAELEKYGKEIPLIKRVKELETELDEEKKLNERYETHIRGLEKELNDARLEAARLEGEGIEIEARWKDTASRLSICLDKLDKLEKENRQINQS
jgi:chromosome segregation ATPase